MVGDKQSAITNFEIPVVLLKRIALATLLSIVAWSDLAFAQQYGRGMGRGRAYPDRSEFPIWENVEEFEEDVFTFARVRYVPHGRRGWDGDYPEADLNISFRLQELTSMKVNPNPVVLELTDPDLKNYPFLFLIAPWSVNFTDDEVAALRDYLLSGGFLMADEFWGPQHWDLFIIRLSGLSLSSSQESSRSNTKFFTSSTTSKRSPKSCPYTYGDKDIPTIQCQGWRRIPSLTFMGYSMTRGE